MNGVSKATYYYWQKIDSALLPFPKDVHPSDYTGYMWANVERRAIRKNIKKGIVTKIREVIIDGT